ncbi:transposase [Streptomyces sp. NPDC006235]|uniref:transposase n=1 Tax=Streptomyces sp. NPDC006235 TaxID=3156736 RepID=UPI0033A91526
MNETKVVRVGLLPEAAVGQASRFRDELYACLTGRGDELLELADAVLCAPPGAVRSAVVLTLLPEHRRGHGAMYDGLNQGRIDTDRLRSSLAGLSLPRFAAPLPGRAPGPGRRCVAVAAVGRAVLAGPTFCHVYGRAKTASQFIPGWPYSFVAVLEMGATSWTQILDTVRLGPADDATAVTAAQLRGVVERLVAAGQWAPGESDIVIVADAGYGVTRLAWVLRDLPVELVGRVRGDRVMRPRVYDPKGGRPPRHGPDFRFTRPETWPEPAVTTRTATANYGKATAQAWDWVPPRLPHRAAWLDHEGELPLVEGTLIRLEVEHLSKDRAAPAVWLWSSKTGTDDADVNRAWQAFLRRFDLEPTSACSSRRWAGRAPAARTGSGRPVDVADHRRLHPAQTRPPDHSRSATPVGEADAPHRLTPARVRRTFRNLRQHMPCPARAPKPHRPGPGRPPGTLNKHRAPRYDVGKTVRREKTVTALQRLED